MIEREFIEPFLNKEVGLVYRDCERDYFLRGILKRVSSNTVLLSNATHGDAIVAISAIKKIKEIRRD